MATTMSGYATLTRPTKDLILTTTRHSTVGRVSHSVTRRARLPHRLYPVSCLTQQMDQAVHSGQVQGTHRDERAPLPE